jgi:UDP-N-acetylglucosamine--dolichyl-phosphate N-acetylglucosaminephosphotransferase
MSLQNYLFIATAIAMIAYVPDDWADVQTAIRVDLVLAILACIATSWLIPQSKQLLIQANLFGRDMHRKGRPQVPEAMGVVVGACYCIALSCFLPFVFSSRSLISNDLKLSMFMASLLSINAMCFLGFADNVLNLRWRVKLIIPFATTLPLLLVYYAGNGSTRVLVPEFFGGYSSIDLGFLFYIFLASLAVFATNAINILAGVNGLEVGQTLVLTGSLILNNIIQLVRLDKSWLMWESHLFSFYLLTPFFAASLALYQYNKYPAEVFVGDTYCYLAGMTIAASGIIGQSSKTVLLFMAPQVLNFLYSIPQLFGIIPCPRHRLPVYVEDRDVVSISYTDWLDPKTELSWLGRSTVYVLESFKLAKVERSRGKLRVQNLTLLCLSLWLFGDMRESSLTDTLLAFQCFWSLIAFVVRYFVAGLVYKVVY